MSKSHILAAAAFAVFGAAASSAWAAPHAAGTGAADTAGSGTFVLVPNLLSAGSPTFSSSSYTGTDAYGSGVSSLNDGVYYNPNSGDTTDSLTPSVGGVATFNLNTSVNTLGYTLTSINSYTGYSPGSLTSQSYTVAFSTVSAPSVFTPYETVSVGNLNQEVQVIITDDSGTLATNVADLQFTFNSPSDTGSSDFIEVFREIEAFGSPTTVPEPASLSLVSLGGMVLLRRRARRA